MRVEGGAMRYRTFALILVAGYLVFGTIVVLSVRVIESGNRIEYLEQQLYEMLEEK